MEILNKIKKGIQYLVDPDYKFIRDVRNGKFNDWSDEKYLKRLFKCKVGYDLDLENPLTFNAKIQWLKINDRNPLYTKLVDKYEVKEYISKKWGDEFLIPTIGVWNSFDEINFKDLPSQFVIKCTHDSGGVVICTDKKILIIMLHE